MKLSIEFTFTAQFSRNDTKEIFLHFHFWKLVRPDDQLLVAVFFMFVWFVVSVEVNNREYILRFVSQHNFCCEWQRRTQYAWSGNDLTLPVMLLNPCDLDSALVLTRRLMLAALVVLVLIAVTNFAALFYCCYATDYYGLWLQTFHRKDLYCLRILVMPQSRVVTALHFTL